MLQHLYLPGYVVKHYVDNFFFSNCIIIDVNCEEKFSNKKYVKKNCYKKNCYKLIYPASIFMQENNTQIVSPETKVFILKAQRKLHQLLSHKLEATANTSWEINHGQYKDNERLLLTFYDNAVIINIL